MEKRPANENLGELGSEDAKSPKRNDDLSAAEQDAQLKDQQAIAAGRRETIVRLMDAMKASETGLVSSRIVHETLLALAVSVFVRSLGREGAAMLVERLPEKIRKGEFGDADE